jgi:hypothetical protein
MSENTSFGFGRMVPGFDFLQNLAKGASQAMPQLPTLSNWVAPTLNVEELEKRISELKAVHFWLEQNSTALGATIQALEVQKMTLATLKGMNFNMADVANALKLRTEETLASGMQKIGEVAGAAADAAGAASRNVAAKGKAVQAEKADAQEPAPAPATGGAVDPLQWWGALTHQFQEIASNAMKDVAQKTAADTARNMAAGAAKDAVKAVTGMAKAGKSARKPARKAAARKTRAKT